MPFTVEDGTGVADANSYTTEAFADAYFLDRGNAAWAAASTANKEIGLVKATDYIELRFKDRWKGILAPEATTLSFPRQYLYDRKGVLIDFETDGIPDDIQKATAEYALRALTADLLPDPVVSDTGQAIKRSLDKVGPIETEVEYEGAAARPDLIRPYPTADRLLKFWISGRRGCYSVMAINYTKLAATAQTLVTDAGRTVTLVKPNQVLADPSKPWEGHDGTEETLEVPAVQLLPNAVRVFGLSALGDAHEFQGMLTFAELVYIVFQGEVELSDYTIVRDEGVDYQIEATQELKPASTTLLGFIGVRR